MVKRFIVDAEDPLSKALSVLIDTTGPAVVVKKKKYFGVIDDRHLPNKVLDSSKVKAKTIAIKAPALKKSPDVIEKIKAFLSGRFRGLAVVNKGVPIGVITRTDLIKELLDEGLIPNVESKYIMNSPVYTINVNESLSVFKKKSKDLKVNRFVAEKGGHPYGVISEYDMSLFLLKPVKKRGKSVVKDVRGILNTIKVKDALREQLVVTRTTDRLGDTCETMVKKKVSTILVKDKRGKIVGVISALDIFRRVLDMFKTDAKITISGLKEPEVIYYQDIKNAFGALVKKYSKSFSIQHITLNIKETKNLYIFHITISMDGVIYKVTTEHHEFEDAVADSVRTLVKFLNKLRAKNNRGRSRRVKRNTRKGKKSKKNKERGRL